MAHDPDSGRQDDSPRRRPNRLLKRGVGRIRRKLILIHTVFSLLLGVILILVIRSPVRDLVAEYEARECRLLLEIIDEDVEGIIAEEVEDIQITREPRQDLGLPPDLVDLATRRPNVVIVGQSYDGWPVAVRYDEVTDLYAKAAVRSSAARAVVNRLYALIIVALLSVYGLIALTLEVVVLPGQVYDPIDRLREADAAVQLGMRDRELIPEERIPRDEFGEIMRSRNQSIRKLREQEHELAEVLERVEVVASELRKKNHLLETARRNLADQDRLASLGMMSAGIAHELNTPLAVLKGSVEMLHEHVNERPDPERVELMLRVIRRLERLSESLLDFARVRPPSTERTSVKGVVDEAWTLVSLDRNAKRVTMSNRIPPDAYALLDGDRMTQVFVNLLRNAVDAMNEDTGSIDVTADRHHRDDDDWISINVVDDGPGIDPTLITRLFEPFASTKLDAQGAGLGLAVADGIVREHGGLIVARNRPDRGSVFEILLPVSGPSTPSTPPPDDARDPDTL